MHNNKFIKNITILAIAACSFGAHADKVLPIADATSYISNVTQKQNSTVVEVKGALTFDDIQNVTIDGYPLSKLPGVKGLTVKETANGFMFKIKGFKSDNSAKLAIQTPKEVLYFDLAATSKQASSEMSDINQAGIKKTGTKADSASLAGGELAISGWIKFEEFVESNWWSGNICKTVTAGGAYVRAIRGSVDEDTYASSTGYYALAVSPHNGERFLVSAKLTGYSNYDYAEVPWYCGDSSNCTDRLDLTIMEDLCDPNQN